MNTIYTTTIPFASGTWGVRYGLFGVPFALLLAGLGMKRMPAPLLILAPFSVAGFYFNATATMYGNMVFKKSLRVLRHYVRFYQSRQGRALTDAPTSLHLYQAQFLQSTVPLVIW